MIKHKINEWWCFRLQFSTVRLYWARADEMNFGMNHAPGAGWIALKHLINLIYILITDTTAWSIWSQYVFWNRNNMTNASVQFGILKY